MQLNTLTVAELQELIKDAQSEIARREAAGNGFEKEYTLSTKKAYNGATYAQVKFADALSEKTGSVIAPTTSQLMKYFSMYDMANAIDLMKAGKRIKIS